jgi:TM2 domain-containing membrane protein YozV
VYASKGSKSINTILLSHIILFFFLLIFLVILVVCVALSRKASGLTLRDKIHNFMRTYFDDSAGDDIHMLIVAPSFTE